MTVNPRSITDAERPWLEAWSLPVQVQLINLVKERASNDVALALAGWLTAKHAGQDLASMPTKASYRKILKELAVEGLSPDPARAKVSSGSARRLRTAVSASTTAAAAVARATPPKPPRMSVLMSTGQDVPAGAGPVPATPAGQLVQLAIWGAGEHAPDTCSSASLARVDDVLEEAA